MPQYYVQNNHPAIIEPDEFDAVQVEMERRKKLGRPSACQSPLSTKLVCGECGGYFGSKVWNSNSKYRRNIWRCNEKYNGDQKCSTPHVTEEVVKQKFVEVFNSLLKYRDELIDNCRLAQKALCDCSSIEAELDDLNQELEVITELAKKNLYDNAHGDLSQEEWNERNTGFKDRHSKAVDRISELENKKSEKQHKKKMLDRFIRNLTAQESVLSDFDERLWTMAIERVVISSEDEMTFQFKDGTEICR